MELNTLTEMVIKASYKVHNTLGAGFLEKIYENSLLIELRKQGLEVVQQYPIPVYYEEFKVGDYSADLFVGGCLIVELKAVETLIVAHEKQLINYLAATKNDVGLLINFGSSVEVKRKYRVYRKT
jgi:GxxExxY protein